MNLKIKPLAFAVTLLLLCVAVNSTTRVSSFKELAQAHCQSFPVELFYRVATGQLSETYGKHYKDFDCYIRQFVNKDGQDTFEEEEEQQGAEEPEEQVPQNDPIVLEYAPGLSKCLPEGTDPVEAVYSMWRFYRFTLQHDYTLQWMRAKIRASLGYQAQKPNAWMDGQQSASRLRLDKLFSNQFYDYVDKLMFRDFLHPIITFFKKNLVFAASGSITQSGKPILVQYIENKNLMDKIFEPVLFSRPEGNLFAYTVPGIPLLLAGSSGKVSWAFTGVLMDRSNIEQIQTLGSKFFHQDSETWIKLVNVTLPIKMKGQAEPFECKFVHSTYGTLYQKHKSRDGGKVSQYIARWHQKQKKVRVVFSQLVELINNDGQTTKQMEFPFNSLVLTNNTGIFQYICPQKHPSYFLYTDLSGQPEPIKNRWVSNFKRNFLVVSNTHLTTKNQQSYIKKEVLNPIEEQFLIDTRRKLATSREKFTAEQLFDFVNNINTDPLIKKRKDVLIYIYRKAKFLFFPEENIRKECDQIIAMLDKWDHNLKTSSLTPAFILWDYFFRDYTFNYISSDPLGAALAKHKVVTEVYWTNQAQNWKVGTSYGECDSDEWNLNYRDKLNGTGQNSTCFFNVLRGINRTRQILRNNQGKPIQEPKLDEFVSRKIKNLQDGYVGTHIQEAFGVFFSKNLAFVAEIDNPKITYFQGYLEERKEISLEQKVEKQEPKPAEEPKEPESPREEQNTEL